MSSDLLGLVIDRLEGCVAVGGIGLDNGNNLVDVNVDVGGTDALASFGDRNRLAVRQRGDAVDVGHTFEFFRLPGVNLDDDLVRGVKVLNVVTDGGGRNDVAFFGDADGLDDGDVHLAEEALLDVHAGLGEVVVHVQGGAVVDLVPKDRIRLVGGAELDGVSLGEDTVAVGSGGCAGEEADHVFVTASVCFLSALCDGGRQYLGVAGTGKARDADVVVVVDEVCGFLGRHDFAAQGGISDAIRHLILLQSFYKGAKRDLTPASV